ncbi:MAG: alpha-glucosidase [Anaerolineales bacterium]|jgi:alpha-glucosidase
MNTYLWWRDAVIYQIYPRSFADSNGDGIGDLPGIISRLDYLADLGIEALWLSPIYPSPDKDFGYDVSDYCNIEPRYGTLADFDRLVAEAHSRGLRLIMDMVMNHTSDQHAWFQESRSSRKSPKRDWYIWKDRPNNWQASFGGKAWEYDQPTGQYYLHLFTKEQPDVNWRNPAVRQAQLEAFRFWMERGVDGFRLDVFNAYFKHPDFPNNPLKFGLRGFDRQKHIYDIDQPEMLPLLNELRALLDSYPERYSVGETYLVTPQKTVSYCGPDKLHAAFSFDFTSNELSFPWNPDWIMGQIARREQIFNAAGIWPATVMSNHDLPRAASRYTKGEGDAQARIAMALLLTLRGTPFMYYGEEIGMRNIALRRSEILDPPGQKYWPIYKGRDGCRSPMQWDNGKNAGFSAAKPWLPVHPDYLQRNVAAQAADPGSLFHFTKKLLGLRKAYPALQRGDYISLETPPGTLAYLRTTTEQSALVAINFKGRLANFVLPQGQWHMLFSSNKDKTDAANALTPYEVRLLIHE